MADKELLRKILEARYIAENCCLPQEQELKTNEYLKLLDQALEGTTHSRLELVEALRQPYKEHRKARRKQDGLPFDLI